MEYYDNVGECSDTFTHNPLREKLHEEFAYVGLLRLAPIRVKQDVHQHIPSWLHDYLHKQFNLHVEADNYIVDNAHLTWLCI